MQKQLFVSDNYFSVIKHLGSIGAKKIFLVCDSSFGFLRISKVFNSVQSIVKFSDFEPNPDYESVKKAVALYRAEGCDMIIAIGGGSAIDLAKCVKLYAQMSDGEEYINQEIVPNSIPFVAMPTTAGTGSEATRYAVIYYKGSKQSITHESCIPSTVIFDPSVLNTLPEYQKKSTLLDALCHSVESFWSVNSTTESKEYARRSLRLILDNYKAYLSGDNSVNAELLKASNLAGKAINISQTTAGHAMCYKLTSLYGTAHGHAAALCVSRLMPYMVKNMEKCVDGRGQAYLEKTFLGLAQAMDCRSAAQLCIKFSDIFAYMDLPKPKASEEDIKTLTGSVNPVRLKNNPVALDDSAIETLYREILF